MKFFNKLQILFLSILILVVVVAGMMSMRPKEIPIEPKGFYCGNAVIDKSPHPYGEKIFKQNCRMCHRVDMDVIGPALSGVTKRRSREWLYGFIQNSQAMIKKGDPDAVNLYIKYKRIEMPSFQTLSTAEIDSILVYIESPVF